MQANVQVSRIETEKLLIELLEKELGKRKADKLYKGNGSLKRFTVSCVADTPPEERSRRSLTSLDTRVDALFQATSTATTVMLWVIQPASWSPTDSLVCAMYPLAILTMFSERDQKDTSLSYPISADL